MVIDLFFYVSNIENQECLVPVFGNSDVKYVNVCDI